MSRLPARLACLLLLLMLRVSAASSEPSAPSPGPAKPPQTEAASAAASASSKEIEPPRAAPAAREASTEQRRLVQLTQAPAEAAAEAAPPAAPEPPRLEISGFVDVYYEYNFNRPPAFVTDGAGNRVRNDPENELRNFDFKHNEIALNLAEVVLERKAAPLGFRIDLDFGKATDWVHSAEPGGTESYKHIQQAYLTAPVRLWGQDDTLDVGKFVTHHGAEVIETKDNWNYTRGLLFAWAIPYYHMGVRYRHPLSPASGLMFHVYNGWNNVEDNNNALSYGVQYYGPLGRKLTLLQNWTGGPELTDDTRNWRHLFDTLLTYNASDRLTFMLNFDYLTEERDGGDISWKGLALYARRALSDRHAFVVRGEWFDDEDGASTGTPQEVKEVTLTYEIKGPSGLLTRAELRYDWSNKEVFDDRNGGQKDNQLTFLLGAVYSF